MSWSMMCIIFSRLAILPVPCPYARPNNLFKTCPVVRVDNLSFSQWFVVIRYYLLLYFTCFISSWFIGEQTRPVCWISSWSDSLSSLHSASSRHGESAPCCNMRKCSGSEKTHGCCQLRNQTCVHRGKKMLIVQPRKALHWRWHS